MAEKIKGQNGVTRTMRVKGCSGGSCSEALEQVLKAVRRLSTLILVGDCDGAHPVLSEGYIESASTQLQEHRDGAKRLTPRASGAASR